MKVWIAIAVASLICMPQTAEAGWSVEIVDHEGDVGTYPSLAFDDDTGAPCTSYRDETNDDLKLACHVESTWDPSRVPDDEIDAGYYSALVIDTGVVHIAYRRGSYVYSVLKHAERIDGTWSLETVDHQAQGVGHSVSMALDQDGFPHISHTKLWGQDTVKYARWTGSSWENQTVIKEGAEDTALVFQGDRPLIALAGAYLGIAELRGRKWKVAVVDPDPAESVSMVVEKDSQGDTLHVVYSSYSPDDGVDLEYTFWTEALGWSDPVFIDQSLEYTPDISLAIHSSQLHVSYYDQANGALKYASFDGGSWSAEIVDSSGDVGLYSSIAVDSLGNPHIAYYDAANGDLRHAVFAETCTSDSDCNDQNICTVDTCDAVTSKCVNTPEDDYTIQCDLGTESGICCSGTCVPPVCNSNSDCFEFDADTCIDIGSCANTCVVTCNPTDGFCPPGPGCGLPPEPDIDCPACDAWGNRKTCNADPRCRWSNQSKDCLPI